MRNRIFGAHGSAVRRRRRRELLAEVAALEVQAAQAASELAAAHAQVRELEREIAILSAEVGAFRAREQQIVDAHTAAERRAKEIEATADAEARALVAGAQEEAARVRGNAHLQVEEVGKQIQQLLALKGRTLASVRAALSELDRSVGRVERGETGAGDDGALRDVEAAASDAPRLQESGNGRRAAPVGVVSGEPTHTGRVEIDAGPFADFGNLSAFERALARLPHVADVYVRRFSQDRASIELTLSEGTPLIAAMRATLPYQLEIESPTPESLRVDVVASLATTY